MKRNAFMAAALAAALAACAQGLTIGPTQSDVSVQVPGSPEAAMRAATAQLAAHGFTVGGSTAGPNGSLVTTPQPVPSELLPAGVSEPQLWVLQVSAAPGSLGGSTVRVAGYRVPANAAPSADPNAGAGQAGLPITAADRGLFDRVRDAAKWIRDGAGKK